MQQASAALSQQGLLNAAALVKLVIDHQVALPSGITSTRDLLSSASALAGFQKTQQGSNWRKLQQAQDDTADDPLLSRAPVLGGDAGTTRVFYLSHGVGGASSPEAMRLALQPDGRALLDWSGSPREAAWKLEADALVLKFDTPYVEEVPAQAPESGNERWTITGLRIQDRGAGNGLFTPVGLRRVGESRHVDYPQITRDLSKSVQLLRRYEAKALVGLDAAALATGKRWIGLNAGSLAQGLQQDILKITGPARPASSGPALNSAGPAAPTGCWNSASRRASCNIAMCGWAWVPWVRSAGCWRNGWTASSSAPTTSWFSRPPPRHRLWATRRPRPGCGAAI